MNRYELLEYLQDTFQKQGCIDYKYIRSASETRYKRIITNFGTLYNAVKIAGINTEVPRSKINEEDCKNEIKRLYAEYGYVNTALIKNKGKVSADSIRRKLGSFSKALEACNIPTNPKQHRNVSKNLVEKELQKLYEKYGYLSKSIIEKHCKYGPKIVNRIYGSFGDMYKTLCINRHPSGYIPTDQELLDEFKRIYGEQGLISQELIVRYGKFSSTCYKDRFGSINNVRKMLNMKSVKPGQAIHAMWIFNKIEKIINDSPEFEKTFEWLINPKTGRNLFVDAYYPNYNLAVEYNGPQHYKLDNKYTKTVEQLEYRQQLDALKIKLLQAHGIKTLTIHYKDTVNNAYLAKVL